MTTGITLLIGVIIGVTMVFGIMRFRCSRRRDSVPPATRGGLASEIKSIRESQLSLQEDMTRHFNESKTTNGRICTDLQDAIDQLNRTQDQNRCSGLNDTAEALERCQRSSSEAFASLKRQVEYCHDGVNAISRLPDDITVSLAEMQAELRNLLKAQQMVVAEDFRIALNDGLEQLRTQGHGHHHPSYSHLEKIRESSVQEASVRAQLYRSVEQIVDVMAQLEDVGDGLLKAYHQYQSGRQSYQGGRSLSGLVQAVIRFNGCWAAAKSELDVALSGCQDLQQKTA